MRVDLSRRSLGTALLAAAATNPHPALAWCGERFPSWAYFLKWDEVDVPFEWNGAKASVRYRVVGDATRETGSGVPPVLVAGTPGLGYEYFENFEALTVSDRRVIEVTFSDTAPIESGSVQLAAVCKSLKVPIVHVVAHGLGAVAALDLVSRSGSNSIRSLSLISPFGALSDLREGARQSVLGLASSGGEDAPAATASPDVPFPVGLKDCSTYKSDAAKKYCEKENVAAMPKPVAAPPPPSRAVGRAALVATASGNARGTCVAEAQASVGGGGNAAAVAPVLSPFFAEAASQRPLGLSGEGLGKRLASDIPSGLPVLLMSGGKRDIVDPEGWSDLPPSLQRVAFGTSGHLPFIEQRDEFLPAILEFFDKADGKTTNREFKFADPVQTVKEFL